MEFANTTAYKFITLSEERCSVLRNELKKEADRCHLKGTILISREGINSTLSGIPSELDCYKAFLSSYPEFSDLTYKDSRSSHQPFSRMLVRLKKEIISMGHPEIQPEQARAPVISPEEFKRCCDQSVKEMVILDTRNDYEVAIGSFKNAVDLNIETFRDFPSAASSLPKSMQQQPIVTFCTGGIRCEKAARYLLTNGFKEVYQLDGGILNYFAKCGGAHWQGECFVFDKRVALDSQLHETQTQQCYDCRGVLTVEHQGGPCPWCLPEDKEATATH